MYTTTTMITTQLFIITIFSSTLIATIIGVLLSWIKESFQKKHDLEQRQFEKLYGPITYHLLAMKVLKINRMELLDEISKEPICDDINSNLNKFSVVNPLISKWHEHKEILKQVLEANAGYIKKNHINLIEDFLDGYIKREITQEGKSARTTEERINKMLNAVEALQIELLGKIKVKNM